MAGKQHHDDRERSAAIALRIGDRRRESPERRTKCALARNLGAEARDLASIPGYNPEQVAKRKSLPKARCGMERMRFGPDLGAVNRSQSPACADSGLAPFRR